MGATGERIRRGLRAAFGHVSWQPPHWAASTATFLHTRAATAAAAARANPRRAVLVGASALALVVAVALLWRWYENRPRPVEIAFTVTAPPVTCYACDPPRPPNPLIVQFTGSTAPLDRAGHTIRVGRIGSEPVPLAANADSEVRRLHWFVGESYVGTSAPGIALAWNPLGSGRYIVRAVDDRGRADSRALDVALVR